MVRDAGEMVDDNKAAEETIPELNKSAKYYDTGSKGFGFGQPGPNRLIAE